MPSLRNLLASSIADMPTARETLPQALITLILCFVYAPVVIATFGYSDDFSIFFVNADSVVTWTYAQGRPLLAFIRYLTLQYIENLDSLRLLRATALLSVIGLTLTYFHVIRYIIADRWDRIAFCLALACLPSLQVYVAWATCAHMPLAAMVASWAAIVAAKAVDALASSRVHCIFYSFFALALILISSALYQPGIMWYWAVVLIFLLDRRFLSKKLHRRKVIILFISGLAFLVICFLTQKLYFVLSPIESANRLTLTNQPFEKLYWLARIQMPLALNLWHLMEPSNKLVSLGPVGLTIGVLLTGYFINCRMFWAEPNCQYGQKQRAQILILRTALICVVVGLTHTHWLVVRDSPQNYRIIAALAAAVWISLAWASLQLASVASKAKVQSVIRRTVLSSVAILALFSCQWNLQKYWITPYGTAYRHVVYSLRTEITDVTTHIHIVRQGRQDGMVKEQLIESFGIPMTNPPWMIEGMIKVALKEPGVDQRTLRITHSDADSSIPDGPETLVIDMREMVLLRASSL